MQQLHTKRHLKVCNGGLIMSRWEHTNKGNNLDLMLSVRHDLGKNDISGDAWLQIQRLKDSLDYKPLDPENEKYGVSNKKSVDVIVEPTHIFVKDLITVYKWSYQLCNMATFLPIFTEVIDNDKVKIEDVPKFDSLMYRVMGE